MVRVFLIFLFLVSSVFGNDLSSVILIESKLFPKIAEINLNKNPKIAIVYDDSTKSEALKMKELIKNSQIIKNIKKGFDAYIFLRKIKKNELKMLLKNKKLIFTANPKDIKNAMFSVYIGVRVYPYINPEIIKEAGIRINPILFKVGRIYE